MDKLQQTTDGQKAKATLRERVRAELKKLSPDNREALSLRLCALLEQQEVWKQARSILFYAPLADEPDIWQLVRDSIAAGKSVALPRFAVEQNRYVACHINDISRDVRTGQFGIREPQEFCSTISVNRLDLVLVPGVAFDLNGHRLGRGKGFYDQLLEAIGGPTCGVAFDEQIVEAVPVESHDVHLSCILTPTRWKFIEGPRTVLK
jgi:5-formyltetrahydrofolate cyclo-ligase